MKTPKERFEAKLRITPGCWIWTANIDRYGYGKIKIAGKDLKAHRFSYSIYVNAEIGSLYVLHRCDNPRCVNPDHLFVGTAADNMKDRDRKGRRSTKSGWPRRSGSSHGRSKLTETDVIAIRSDSRTQVEIAKQFGVGRTQISKIKCGENWRAT